MKQNSKVTYKTSEGKVFKTIAPVSEMIAFDYMTANYSNEIEILSIKPTVKKGYRKFCNIRVN